MNFKEAYQNAQPGHYIKPIGNSFCQNGEYYLKTKHGVIWFCNGASSTLEPAVLKKYMQLDLGVKYGIYTYPSEFSRLVIEKHC